MSRATRFRGALLARSGSVSVASLGTNAGVQGFDDGAAVPAAQGVGVRDDGDSAPEEAVEGHKAERLNGSGIGGSDDSEVGILGGVRLDRAVEVEEGVAGQAEAGGEQVAEVGKLGREAHATEGGGVGHLAWPQSGAGGGTEPDLRGGTGKGAHAHHPLPGEAGLQFGDPDIAADAKVVVAERHLDGDVALAEDAEAEAAVVRLGAEEAGTGLVAVHRKTVGGQQIAYGLAQRAGGHGQAERRRGGTHLCCSTNCTTASRVARSREESEDIAEIPSGPTTRRMAAARASPRAAEMPWRCRELASRRASARPASRSATMATAAPREGAPPKRSERRSASRAKPHALSGAPGPAGW